MKVLKTVFPIALLLVLILSSVQSVSCGDDGDDNSDDSEDMNGDIDDDSSETENSDDDNDLDDGIDDDPSGEVWPDPLSGLMWQNGDAFYQFDWYEAQEFCQDLDWGGYVDWRLPTISELRSLIRGCPDTETGGSCRLADDCLGSACWDESCYGCVQYEGPSDGCYWPDQMNGDCNIYWSSSSEITNSDSYSWAIYFDAGLILKGASVDPSILLARCVRGDLSDDDSDDDSAEDDIDDDTTDDDIA